MTVNEHATMRLITAAALAVVLLPGCKKAGSSFAESPTSGADYAMAPDEDPLAKLDALEGRMVELGLPVAAGDAGGAEKARDRSGEAFAPPPPEGDGAAAEFEDAESAPEAMPEEEPAPAPTSASLGGDSPSRADSRCEDLCSLNEAICELEIKICELSETHEGDPTYADACERAIDDCSTSGDACDSCHV